MQSMKNKLCANANENNSEYQLFPYVCMPREINTPALNADTEILSSPSSTYRNFSRSSIEKVYH